VCVGGGWSRGRLSGGSRGGRVNNASFECEMFITAGKDLIMLERLS